MLWQVFNKIFFREAEKFELNYWHNDECSDLDFIHGFFFLFYIQWEKWKGMSSSKEGPRSICFPYKSSKTIIRVMSFLHVFFCMYMKRNRK